MRRPSLKRYLLRELKWLCKLERFNLREAAFAAQQNNPRALAPLVLYAIHTNRVNKLLQYIEDESLKDDISSISNRLENVNLERVAIRSKRPKWMTNEYWKHLRSFSIAWHAPENRAKGKQVFRQCINSMRKAKGLDMKAGFSSIGERPSNGYAFLAGNDNALTYESAAALAKWAREQPVQEAETKIDDCEDSHENTKHSNR